MSKYIRLTTVDPEETDVSADSAYRVESIHGIIQHDDCSLINVEGDAVYVDESLDEILKRIALTGQEYNIELQ